jgi:glycerate 2-kinase
VTQRVLIAADKFKGSLTAVQVAERVTAGLRRVVPELQVELLPVADGGDGTVDAAVAACFERCEVRVAGPLSHEVTAAVDQVRPVLDLLHRRQPVRGVSDPRALFAQ